MPDDPTLWEMNVYPRSGHIMAALVGSVFGSPFLGMHLVTLASLVLLWASCLALLYAAPGRTGPLAALALATLVVFTEGGLIHGAEIAPNYFFSQLIAQALGFMAIVIALWIERHWHRGYVYAFLLAAIWVMTDVHLLPTLELLGVFAGVLLLDLLRSPAGRERIGAIIVALALLMAGIATVVLHPSFSAMRSISENNGGLNLGIFGEIWSIAVLCLVVLVSCIPMLRSWWRASESHALYKYLALYGAAVAGLCLLQMVLRFFNLGSDYAVKKYVFGLVSFLFLIAALWVGNAAGAALASRTRATRLLGSAPLRVAIFGLALFFTVSSAGRTEPQADTSDIVAAERQLTSLRDSVLSPAPTGKYNLVADIAGMPVVVNYMFSLAVARTPREVAGHDFLAGTTLGPWERYGVIVSSRGHSRYAGADRCASMASGPLVVLDATCLSKVQREAALCKGSFDFSTKGRIDPGMLAGFSGAEQEFRWTEGTQVSFTCTADEPRSLAKLALAPFLTPAHKRQRVSIAVNDAAPIVAELSSASVSVVELPLPQVAPGQEMRFTIDLPDAVSPQSLGMSADGRRLGVAVRSLSFE